MEVDALFAPSPLLHDKGIKFQRNLTKGTSMTWWCRRLQCLKRVGAVSIPPSIIILKEDCYFCLKIVILHWEMRFWSSGTSRNVLVIEGLRLSLNLDVLNYLPNILNYLPYFFVAIRQPRGSLCLLLVPTPFGCKSHCDCQSHNGRRCRHMPFGGRT